MIVGLPVDLGRLRRALTGASLPICGGIARSSFGGESQEDNSCMVVILKGCDLSHMKFEGWCCDVEWLKLAQRPGRPLKVEA